MEHFYEARNKTEDQKEILGKYVSQSPKYFTSQALW